MGLAPPRTAYAPSGRITHVSVHHGGPVGKPRWTFRSAAATWRSFQSYHQGKGWNDIGYHLGVDGRGRLYAGRPVGTLPAAVEGHNSGSVAIVFMQDGRYHKLTRRQRRTLRRLFVYGIPKMGLPPLADLATNPGNEYGVFGHREYPGHEWNACPGSLIQRHLEWRRERYL